MAIIPNPPTSMQRTRTHRFPNASIPWAPISPYADTSATSSSESSHAMTTRKKAMPTTKKGYLSVTHLIDQIPVGQSATSPSDLLDMPVYDALRLDRDVFKAAIRANATNAAAGPSKKTKYEDSDGDYEEEIRGSTSKGKKACRRDDDSEDDEVVPDRRKPKGKGVVRTVRPRIPKTTEEKLEAKNRRMDKENSVLKAQLSLMREFVFRD
ncbi:hypothetical protein BDN72DRAFT_855033 [Pluteus cervinus]|uniref:Uncharacterized protein n=1 Tax=Pluteus cervinus TaxID=181527 RepID=A0ACD3B3V5_9AGAR|nr:hypothetical protein BDN72DRAFT_855033 [Pluteus cervinus]